MITSNNDYPDTPPLTEESPLTADNSDVQFNSVTATKISETILETEVSDNTREDNENIEIPESSDDDKPRRYQNLRKQIDVFLSITVKLAILAGSVFAIYQFYEAKTDFRIGKTFDYISQYQQGRLLEARENIRQQIRLLEYAFINDMASEDHKTVVKALVEGDAGPPLAKEVDLLLDFFMSLKLCIDQDLCESSVVKAFFYEQSKYYWKIFKPYIENRSDPSNPKYAKGLEWFATKAYLEESE